MRLQRQPIRASTTDCTISGERLLDEEDNGEWVVEEIERRSRDGG